MNYSIAPKEFLRSVVAPGLGPFPAIQAADALVLGTAMHESHLKYTRQIGGPALGYFQMEPATHLDIHKNFLAYNKPLKEQIMLFLRYSYKDVPPAEELVVSHKYAAAMCRAHYLRVKAPLPAFDPLALAQYWKKYYNTALGKGTIEQALPHFEEACRVA
jgi:hypothetical protein